MGEERLASWEERIWLSARLRERGSTARTNDQCDFLLAPFYLSLSRLAVISLEYEWKNNLFFASLRVAHTERWSCGFQVQREERRNWLT